MRDLDKRARARAISLDDPEPATPAHSATKAPVIAPAPSPPLLARTNTAPGALAKFMVDKSETHKENTLLKAKLAEFEDALPVRQLDPKCIVPSAWANRIDASFASAAFAQLKAEIQCAGGNIQPIKVRPRQNVPCGPGESYEIVFGHRRHRACLELGLPVNAFIATELDDQTLYLEMERENRNREDLSAWEQGATYSRALDSGLFSSIRQLATAIDRDQSLVSKAIGLAKLPVDVVSAFASPLDLQFRWSTELRESMQKDPEGILGRARSIQQLSPRPSSASVFAMLIGTTSPETPDGPGPLVQWKGVGGRKLATMKSDRKGRVTVAISEPLDDARQKELGKFLDAFLKGSVRA